MTFLSKSLRLHLQRTFLRLFLMEVIMTDVGCHGGYDVLPLAALRLYWLAGWSQLYWLVTIVVFLS